jgi:hypothetical protein
MRIGVSLVILTAFLTFPGMTQERKEAGREKEPSATTSTRSKPATRQDVNDTPKPKARETEKRPPSKPARVDSKNTKSGKSAAKNEGVQDARPTDNVDPWDEHAVREQRSAQTVREDHQRVFDDVRNGLNSGSIASFAEMLGPQVHVNLRGGESGYFSSSQAYYVLENYLRSNRFSGLQFSTVEQAGDAPFATGRADLDQKGMKGAAQVYVSLSQVGGKWVISQIKIY